jgi:hypothetical protein
MSTFDFGVRRPLQTKGVVFSHVGQLAEAHSVVAVNNAGECQMTWLKLICACAHSRASGFDEGNGLGSNIQACRGSSSSCRTKS